MFIVLRQLETALRAMKNYIDKIVPRKVSELQNDAEYITENDVPTPDWTATSSEPGYIDNKPNIISGTGNGSVTTNAGHTVTGTQSASFGAQNNVSGNLSFSVGVQNNVSGGEAFAAGNYNIANHESQFVFGQFNAADPSNTESSLRGTYIEIVGNGDGTTAGGEVVRSNARTLDWEGNQWIAGNMKVGGTSYDDSNAKEIATKEYVNRHSGADWEAVSGEDGYIENKPEIHSGEGRNSIKIHTQSEARGAYSLSLGGGTKANGSGSFAVGENCVSSGRAASSFGANSISNHKSQNAFGEFNVADPSAAAATARGNYVEIVGNGTADNARSNARTLDWSGNEWLSGTLKVGGTGYTDSNAKEVATKDYVDTAIAGIDVSGSKIISGTWTTQNNQEYLDYDDSSMTDGTLVELLDNDEPIILKVNFPEAESSQTDTRYFSLHGKTIAEENGITTKGFIFQSCPSLLDDSVIMNVLSNIGLMYQSNSQAEGSMWFYRDATVPVQSVQVNGVPIVDDQTRIANIDLSDYVSKSNLPATYVHLTGNNDPKTGTTTYSADMTATEIQTALSNGPVIVLYNGKEHYMDYLSAEITIFKFIRIDPYDLANNTNIVTALTLYRQSNTWTVTTYEQIVDNTLNNSSRNAIANQTVTGAFVKTQEVIEGLSPKGTWEQPDSITDLFKYTILRILDSTAGSSITLIRTQTNESLDGSISTFRFDSLTSGDELHWHPQEYRWYYNGTTIDSESEVFQHMTGFIPDELAIDDELNSESANPVENQVISKTVNKIEECLQGSVLGDTERPTSGDDLKKYVAIRIVKENGNEVILYNTYPIGYDRWYFKSLRTDDYLRFRVDQSWWIYNGTELYDDDELAELLTHVTGFVQNYNSIDDTAGSGDTNVTWSADKIVSELVKAGSCKLISATWVTTSGDQHMDYADSSMTDSALIDLINDGQLIMLEVHFPETGGLTNTKYFYLNGNMSGEEASGITEEVFAFWTMPSVLHNSNEDYASVFTLMHAHISSGDDLYGWQYGNMPFPVSDVRVNGTSVVNNGVAAIPVASSDVSGVVKASQTNGIYVDSNGVLSPTDPTDLALRLGNNMKYAVNTARQHAATFYGLAKAAGDTTQSASSNAIGTYTDNAKASIKAMLGVTDGVDPQTVTVTGTDPVITGVPNARYICGEVYSLDIIPPSAGIIDVIFTCGSTVTVLTLPQAVRMPEWWDGPETGYTYEICITDGTYAVITSWPEV